MKYVSKWRVRSLNVNQTVMMALSSPRMRTYQRSALRVPVHRRQQGVGRQGVVGPPLDELAQGRQLVAGRPAYRHAGTRCQPLTGRPPARGR